MTIPQDLVTAGPFVLAVLLAMAVLVVDLARPGNRNAVVAVVVVRLFALRPGQSSGEDSAAQPAEGAA